MVHDQARKAFSATLYLRDGVDFLLAKHRRLGLWLPPGGEIEPGERPLEAALRELREELGPEAAKVAELAPATLGFGVSLSAVGPGTPRGLLAYEEHDAGSRGIHMNFAFLLRLSRSVPLKLSAEHDLFAWADSNSTLEIPPNVREIMDRARFVWPEGR